MIAAPLGLRRVQAALEQAYGKASVRAQHPLCIEDAIGPNTKVVGISTMSPLGMGPVDTALSWYNETWNRRWFTILTSKLRSLKCLYKFKVVVGGAGAWQLTDIEDHNRIRISPRKQEFFGVDHVVDGEADATAPTIFQQVEQGTAPQVIRVLTNSIAELSYIPEITAPTLTGLVECMRGCGRGCDFCAPNLRTKRDFPPERVAREAAVNIKHGDKSVWLQTEELTLYGCENTEKLPNPNAIVELYQTLKAAGAELIGATHWTFAGVRAAPELIRQLAEINGITKNGKWMGVQRGLEYASPRLVKRFMPYKVKPYTPEEYPETVRIAIKIMNQNHYYPACTLIVGHPGEQDDEVEMTIDLIRELSLEHRVRGIFAPLLYVDYWNPSQTMTFHKMTLNHFRLYYECWKHNTREFMDRVWEATQSFGPIERLVSYVGVRTISWYIRDFLKREVRRRFGRVPNWIS